MWVLTILHERVTAVDPLRNEMGEGPAAMSLVGHLLFGAIVGLLLTWPW